MTPAELPLRDIHLPPPVSPWPPAPGWWLLAILVLASSLWLGRKLWRRYQARRAANTALRRLAAIEVQHRESRDVRALASALSVLLRQTALAYFPRRDVAGLAGEDWLLFLDTRGGGQAFREGLGRWLIDAPYHPDPSLDAEILIGLCRDWLLAVRREAGRRV